MTKTSTPTNLVNVPESAPVDRPTAEAEQDELFYNSLKPQLDELVLHPSDVTIDKILAYSRIK